MKRNEQKENRKRMNSQAGSQKLPPLNKKHPQVQNQSVGNISYQDEGLISLLYEYFIKNNFMDSLESFQKDCQKGFKPNHKSMDAFKQEMIQAFEQGARDVFFARFNQFVPISIRSKDLQIMKLQFYIHVYFFVFSIHPQLGKKRQIDQPSKQAFANYLEGKGAYLAKSNEFLQYYALAYLSKPQEHPNFKVIFTKEWIGELKKRVIYFIDKLYPVSKIPVIVNIYDKFIEKNMERTSQQSITEPDEEYQVIEEQIESLEENQQRSKNIGNSNVNEVQQSLRSPTLYDEKNEREREEMSMRILQLEEEKSNLLKFIENMKIKNQSIQNNYQEFTEVAQNTLLDSQTKWFRITQEFYNIANQLLEVCWRVENMKVQDTEKVDKISHKLRKYETFVNTNIEDLISDNIDFSLFERPDQDLSMDFVRRNTEVKYQNLMQIDFAKIKECLNRREPGFTEEKCILLDALKNRIIKTRGIVLKREVVLSVTTNDVLGLKNGNTVINMLLDTENESLFIRTSQFIAALAKDYYGREYLANDFFLEKTIAMLKDPKTNETGRMLILSTIQRLSVRSVGQKKMIESDLIKWIVHKLEAERDSMSEMSEVEEYIINHVTALLVNLILRKQGLAKAEEIKQKILQTLIDLLEVQKQEIRSYVHGAMYPLFSKKVFREKAKEYGIEENINYLLENTTVQLFTHQLRYLQKQLKMKEDAVEEEFEDDNDIDEISDEEIGEDFVWEIQSHSSNMVGEEFLLKKFSLTGPDAINQLNKIREEVENTLKKRSVYMANSFYERPSTNNPVLDQIKRNVSHNNSVYSNRSSNRILRSEHNNRPLLGNNGNTRNQIREKLDTVQPDNSDKEMSLKDFVNETDEKPESRQIKSNNNKIVRRGNEIPSQGDSRKKEDSDLFPGFKNEPALENDSGMDEEGRRARETKPYETTEEYKQAFGTRAKLVRTPPQK